MRASGAGATNPAEPARTGDGPTDNHDAATVRDYRLSIQRQRRAVPVRDRAMDHGRHASFFKRPAAGIDR